MRSLSFLWDSDSRLENLGLQTPTPGPKSELRLRLYDLLCDIMNNDCLLKDDLIEILNSSNTKCTIV